MILKIIISYGLVLEDGVVECEFVDGFCEIFFWILMCYFYDDCGFEFFECIIELFEYYQMCIEKVLFEQYVVVIIEVVQVEEFVEFGLGVVIKICVLFLVMCDVGLL